MSHEFRPHVALARSLVGHGADVTIQDRDVSTPLHHASMWIPYCSSSSQHQRNSPGCATNSATYNMNKIPGSAGHQVMGRICYLPVRCFHPRLLRLLLGNVTDTRRVPEAVKLARISHTILRQSICLPSSQPSSPVDLDN